MRGSRFNEGTGDEKRQIRKKISRIVSDFIRAGTHTQQTEGEILWS